MSHRPTVTAAVITLNEEQHLPGWLEAHAWADERLVVDGGSTDGTVTLARAAGARVVERRFDDFSRQRNFALSGAGGDWVWFADADERPTTPLVSEIRQRVTHDSPVAYRAPIRSVIFGRAFRFCGTQDDRPIRLLRRGRGRWVGGVHEVLHADGAVGRLRGWLDHTTMPDLRSFLCKMNRYTTLQAEGRWRVGRRPSWRDAWLAPGREIFRRLVWKHGWLDGPEGWAFAFLSGLSEWVLAGKLRKAWEQRGAPESWADVDNVPAELAVADRDPIAVAA